MQTGRRSIPTARECAQARGGAHRGGTTSGGLGHAAGSCDEQTLPPMAETARKDYAQTYRPVCAAPKRLVRQELVFFCDPTVFPHLFPAYYSIDPHSHPQSFFHIYYIRSTSYIDPNVPSVSKYRPESTKPPPPPRMLGSRVPPTPHPPFSLGTLPTPSCRSHRERRTHPVPQRLPERLREVPRGSHQAPARSRLRARHRGPGPSSGTMRYRTMWGTEPEGNDEKSIIYGVPIA